MRIIHSCSGIVEKQVREKAGYMLANNKGGYFSQGIESRYSGMFLYLDDMYRILDSIVINEKITTLTNNQWNIEASNKSASIKYFMPHGYNALVCSLSQEKHVTINFDVRKSYDLRKWGKDYKFYEESDCLVVEFTKKTDSREDSSEGDEEYRIFIAITGQGLKYRFPGRWVAKQYNFDNNRGSGSDEWFVFEGLHVLSDEIIISASFEKEKAIKDSLYVRKNIKKLANAEKRKADASFREIENKELAFAYNSVVRSIRNLCIGMDSKQNPGIFAGLPWFFQYWTRDEAISVKSLMLLKEYKFASRILFRQLQSIGAKGRIPNRSPSTDIDSADGTGWMFSRISDLMSIPDKRLRKKYFDKFFQGYAKGQIEKSLRLLYQNYTSADLNKFALNGPQETWMDTVWDDDNRAGSRIEIQALRLAMYNLAYELSGKSIFKELEENLKEKVKEHFWNKKTLADGLNDWTIRPNIFIAAYVYPDILTKKEWKICIKNTLSKLWLSWGGISTIDKTHPMFCQNYTGEHDQSYHRGDSWFWLNNLAAIVMARTDRKYFSKYIDKIVQAGIKDILYKGMIGHMSEVSSASRQKAEGSLCQAWSAAMFIELVHELYPGNFK